VAAAFALCCAAAPAALAQTYTVKGMSDPSPTPSCSATVCPSVRAAVAAANASPGSTIQLGSGIYTLSQGVLHLTAGVTIAGKGRSATTIKQTAPDRVIWARPTTRSSSPTVSITGLTITGGNLVAAAGAIGGNPGNGGNGGVAEGGGILNYGTMTLTNVALTGNTATGGNGGGGPYGHGGNGGNAFGGAIATGDASDPGSLTLVSTTVSGNVTQAGDGGFSATSGAGGGGAAEGVIFSTYGSITLRSSTVSGNHVLGGSGGTATQSSATAGPGEWADGAVTALSLTITNSTVAGNATTGGAGGEGFNGAKGGWGGGQSIGGGVNAAALTATGSTFVANTATGGAGGSSTDSSGGDGGLAGAGGIYAESGNLVNDTITGNTAAGGVGGDGVTSGRQSDAFGGGVWVSTPGHVSTAVVLASVTLANNTATGDASATQGGNLFVEQYGNVALSDTIIAAGSASTSVTGNCYLNSAAARTDNGNNLEDTTPSQCGFSSSNADLVGATPGLLGLASNGGPTQTLALGPASQALGTGGACTDPTKPGKTALSVDQRGLPRPAGACDIGAYQLQPPAGTAAPQITGTPAVGQKLACSQGKWSGDQPKFAYRWLRDGATINAASTASYIVASDDQGHHLACKVTASNAKGTASQTSATVIGVANAARTSGVVPSTTTTATVQGAVNPTGKTTTYRASYAPASSTWCKSGGTSGTPAGSTTAQTLAYTDSSFHAVSVNLTGLTAASKYCAAITAQNPSGGYIGVPPITFTAGAPTARTSTARATTTTTATVTGSVDPAAQTTTYGAVYDLASSTWCTTHGTTGTPAHATTPATLASADGSFHPVTVALSGLTASTKYCAAITAHNASGKTTGAPTTFTS
jgi:hypothetical protein